MDEYAKSQFIYEQMEFVKKLFLREIKILSAYGLWKRKNILGIDYFRDKYKLDFRIRTINLRCIGIGQNAYGFNPVHLIEHLYISTATIRWRDSSPDRYDVHI